MRRNEEWGETKNAGPPCMAYRKMIRDLIDVYKMLNGGYASDIKPLLALKSETKIRQTRQNSKNLYK